MEINKDFCFRETHFPPRDAGEEIEEGDNSVAEVTQIYVLPYAIFYGLKSD